MPPKLIYDTTKDSVFVKNIHKMDYGAFEIMPFENVSCLNEIVLTFSSIVLQLVTQTMAILI